MKTDKKYEQIIAKLRGLRAENNLTLEEVGNKIGVGRDTLSLYENSKRRLPLSIFLKLLEVYNVLPDIFFKTILDNSREN